MDTKAIYRKTAKGVAEITASQRQVDRRLRPLLILIDGNRTAMHVHALVGGIGIREEDFDELVTGGFIEAIAVPDLTAADGQVVDEPAAAPVQPRTDLERYSDGKRYLCETAADNLGLRSFLFVLKVEKCSSADELFALVPEFETALARKVDVNYARQCRRIAESILKP